MQLHIKNNDLYLTGGMYNLPVGKQNEERQMKNRCNYCLTYNVNLKMKLMLTRGTNN